MTKPAPDRWQVLIDLRYALIDICGWGEFCTRHLDLGETETLCKELRASTTLLSPLLRMGQPSPSVRKTLISWAKQNASMYVPVRRGQIIQGQPGEMILLRTWLDIPEEFHDIEIWSDEGLYWHTAIRYLAWWWSENHIQSGLFKWSVDDQYVTLEMRGDGRFGNVRRMDIGAQPDFWILNVKSELVQVPQASLAAALLLVQLVAQEGGGKLTLAEFNEEQATLHLSIPRGGVNSVGAEGTAWSQSGMAQAKEHIIRQAIAGILDVLKRLEATLAEVFPRVEASFEKGEIDELDFIGLRDKTLGKLTQVFGTIDDLFAQIE